MKISHERPGFSGPLSFRKKLLCVVAAAAIFFFIGAIGLYAYIACGGLIARQNPTALETFIAQGLVNLSIPNAAKFLKSPLDPNGDASDVLTGRDLYLKHCESCHGSDGSGSTAASSGLYPPPLDLRRSAVVERKRTDGDLFYFIRNGVRNTGMPGWQFTDQQTWQIVAFIHTLPETASLDPASTEQQEKSLTTAHYIGSLACQKCHANIYERWQKTPMANVVRDPHEHPDAFIPDFSKSDPLLNFTKADVAFIYGSRWKQRYFKKVGDDYFPFPAQWDIANKQWRPYFAKDDWWAPLYPPDNFKRPTSALCDGCHAVNYNIKTKTVTEWNVGCEKCHGPGSEHAEHPTSSNIINTERRGYVAANDACMQCHSQGRPLENPIAGQYYDWPVGYDVTRKLSDFWKLEEHKLGETSFTHFADGTAHKNRMQGNDFVTSLMYTHGVTCSTCHDMHGTENAANLRKPGNALCLDCHGPRSPNGPHAQTIEAHTHHKSGSAGSDCIACHMPKVAQTIADINVRSHTFRFVSPADTEALKIPNACNICHSDKSAAWATAALQSWEDRSPWRVAN